MTSKNQSLKDYQLLACEKARQRSTIQLKKDFQAGSANDEEFYDRRVYYDSNTKTEYYPWMFSKTLEHDDTTGFPKKSDVEKVIKGSKEGGSSMDDIPKHPNSVRKLEGVAAANSFNLFGTDSSVPRAEYKAIDSEGSVFGMAEVYAKSVKRDTSFWDIESLASSDVCISTLNNFTDKTTAPTDDTGSITGKTLFRGAGPEETEGPYVSQFLMLPFNYGNIKVDQKFEVEDDAADSVTMQGWLQLQNGITPEGNNKNGQELYCYSGRVLGSKVHNDPLYQFYYNAALIACENGMELSAFSHDKTSTWTSGGDPDVLASVAHVALGALRVAWYQKWCVAMRIRPEVMAQRIKLAYESSEDFVKRVPGLKNIKDICDDKCGDLLTAVMNANNVDVPLIPHLTSDTSHDGYTVSSSSTSSGPNREAFKAFNGNDFNHWCSADGLYDSNGTYQGTVTTLVDDQVDVSGEWVQMDFDTCYEGVGKVSITTTGGRADQGMLVYDSGDGVWRVASSFTSQPPSGENFEQLPTPVSMKKVRFILQKDVNALGCIQGIQIFTGQRHLKLQFPEGSPTHPSLPSGHATVSGACCTVLKAMLSTHDIQGSKKEWPLDVKHSLTGATLDSYDGSTTGMTIVGELNKLASNVAIGRSIAGLHYRCDGDSGVKLGEHYAVSYLIDKAKEYSESYNGVFEGFTLEKFDGSTVKITHEGVEVI